MSKSKVLAGLLVGAAAGAVLGLLLAPEKGSDMRKKISDKKNKFGDDLKNKFGEVKETLKGKYENIRSDASEMLEKEREAKRNFG
ncbi:MAG: YtxH domain-containing protein [Gloeobacteraceae cyanobacterium ES-bin-316]|nr:YtxH domain-containing protein [Ferruginibacter sp.]